MSADNPSGIRACAALLLLLTLFSVALMVFTAVALMGRIQLPLTAVAILVCGAVGYSCVVLVLWRAAKRRDIPSHPFARLTAQ